MILRKLEEIKQAGNYAVTLYYGEDTGCDDLDVKLPERVIKISATPVGVLGSVKILWIGNWNTLPDFDPKSKPTLISNPPKSIEYEKNGFYVWGTDDGIDGYMKKFST